MKLSRNEKTILTWLKNGQHIGCQGQMDDALIRGLVHKGLLTVKYHPETDYTSVMLREISVKYYGAEPLTMSFAGIGAYPYDCTAKDNYPNDAIYKCKHGSWISLREYDYDPETQEYFLPYALI